MGMVLWAIYYILLVIILVALILVITPVNLLFKIQDGEITLQIRIFRIKFTLFPKKEKKTPEIAFDDKPPQMLKKKKFSFKQIIQVYDKFSPLISAVSSIAVRVFAAIRIREIELFIPISGTSAAEIAINCGKTAAVVYPFIAVARQVFDTEFTSLDILPDYKDEMDLYVFFRVYATLLDVIFATIYVAKNTDINEIIRKVREK